VEQMDLFSGAMQFKLDRIVACIEADWTMKRRREENEGLR
jgi:hypothetical protein